MSTLIDMKKKETSLARYSRLWIAVYEVDFLTYCRATDTPRKIPNAQEAKNRYS